jgi:uncharacterized protein YprB with RNaseH-like and TPR domain
MRHLTSRLREIVARERAAAGARHVSALPDHQQTSILDVAAELGGGVHEAGGSRCVAIDRTRDADDWHGRRRVGSFAPAGSLPLALFDARFASGSDWAARVVFFDLETTGLSGGAGTLPFVTGCGWFEDERFITRQFVLAGPAGEHAMLDALSDVLDRATMLVTFNGGSFDLPVMEMRWAFHRRDNPAGTVPHFDMLPPARRFWGRRDTSASLDAQRCNLTALERDVLGFHRIGDVAGIEIPARYFHFLRSGDAGVLIGVLDHNRHDLLSLAGLMSRVLALAEDGPEACREASEQLALGQLYERAGDLARAVRAYDLASTGEMWGGGVGEVRQHAFARLAVLHRRERRHEEAASAWRQVIAIGRQAGGEVTPLERLATEALAIHHEHRVRDLPAARRYAQRLRGQATGRRADDTTRRLARLDKKLERAGKGVFSFEF